MGNPLPKNKKALTPERRKNIATESKILGDRLHKIKEEYGALLKLQEETEEARAKLFEENVKLIEKIAMLKDEIAAKK